MNQKSTRILTLSVLLLVFGATQAFGQVIYDSTVSPQPGNLPSVGAEAFAFNEFGDGITFAGTVRTAKTVTITMSSWGCQRVFCKCCVRENNSGGDSLSLLL